jgi:hypothetical protein
MVTVRSAGCGRLVSGLLLAMMLLSCSSGTAMAQQVSHPTMGYTFNVPPGFVEAPEILATNPKFTHAFHKPMPGDDLGVMLIVERMGGTIGGGRVKQSDLPRGLNATLLVLQWQGVDIDVIEFTESSALGPFFNVNAQIPLKREAVQLKVAGKQAYSVEVRTAMAQTLGTLKGESNLIPGAIPGLSSLPMYPALLVLIGLSVMVGGTLIIWRTAQSGERGQALAIAIGLWVVGGAISALRIRELMVIGGSMALTGVIGLLGLFFGWVIRKTGSAFSGQPAAKKKKKSAAPVRKRQRTQYDEYGNVIEE